MKNINILIIIIISVLFLGIISLSLTGFSVLNTNKDKNTIKIGVITPLSGNASVYGQDVINAKTMAINEINENGGILGKKFKLIYEDGKCDSKEALISAQKLVNVNNVKIIFGGVCSSETLAIAPFTEENKVILFSSGSSSPEITNIGDYVFRNYPSESVLGIATADLVYNDGLRNIGVLVENTDYSLGILNVFKERFKELKGNISIIETYDSESKDYRSQLLKIKNTNIYGLLFLPQTGKTGGLAVKQAKELGINVSYYGNAQMNGTEALENGGQAINNLKFIDAPMLDSKDANSFLNKYNNLYDRPSMNYFVGAEYDAVYIIKDAIEYCGKVDTNCIKDYLYDVEYSGVLGEYSFDKYGDVENIKFSIKQIIDAENDDIRIIN